MSGLVSMQSKDGLLEEFAPPMKPDHSLIKHLRLLLVGSMLGMWSFTTWAQDPAATESSSAQSSSQKPLYADRFERDNQLLAKANPSEIRWLTTPSEKLVVLYKAGETRKTKGALLLMHASETPQRWPESLEELRRNLPLYGWATYALPLPARASIKIPPRTSSAAASSEGDSTAATSEAASSSSSSSSAASSIGRNQSIGERVDAAVQDLNKIGIFNVVVLVDNSTAPEALNGLFAKINASTSTDQTMDGPVQALVLVNLQEQEPLTQEQLVAIFANEKLPVIDVFSGQMDAALSLQKRIHKAEAMRKNLHDYQQYQLTPEPMPSINESSRFWIEKIRGFMEQKAEGNEFKNPEKVTAN